MKIAYAKAFGKKHSDQSGICSSSVSSYKEDGSAALAVSDADTAYEKGAECAAFLSQWSVSYLRESALKDQDFDEEDFKDRLIMALNENGFTKSNSAADLMFIAVKKDRYVSGHMGSGAIMAGSEGGIGVFAFPDSSEGTAGYCLPSDKDDMHMTFEKGVLKKCSCFMFASGAISRMFYDKDSHAAAAACVKLMQWAIDYPENTLAGILQENADEILSAYSKGDFSLALFYYD